MKNAACLEPQSRYSETLAQRCGAVAARFQKGLYRVPAKGRELVGEGAIAPALSLGHAVAKLRYQHQFPKGMHIEEHPIGDFTAFALLLEKSKN